MTDANSAMEHQPPTPPASRPRAVRLGFLLKFAILSYLGGLAFLLFLENRLVYAPHAIVDRTWQPASGPEEVHFVAEDGVRLHGWFFASDGDNPVVLFHHGNGGNITHRAFEAADWVQRAKVSVFVFDYRGYGKSQGAPTEAGIYRDSLAAYRYLTDVRKYAPRDILLYGESLGGAVAIQLATVVKCQALIVRSTFTSLPDVAARIARWFPVRWVMQNRYPSLERIGKYRGPFLLIHGTADELVPFAMGEQLYQAAKEPKEIVVVSGGDHNLDLFGESKAAEEQILAFLARCRSENRSSK